MEKKASDEFTQGMKSFLPYLNKLDVQYHILLDEIEVPVLNFDLNGEGKIPELIDLLENNFSY